MPELGLYIHIPFCVRKCAYCDFLSAPAEEGEIPAYAAALVREIGSAALTDGSYEVTSVFIGGGTPSLLPARTVEEIFRALYGSFSIRSDAEVTMEMNPGTIRQDFLACAAKYINRASLGVQSASAAELSALRRIHTFKDAKDAVRMLRKEGIRNINLDLMTGIPHQTERSFRETLREVLLLHPEHISCYSLILEEGTPFMDAYRAGRLSLPDEDEERRMAAAAEETLAACGYRQYEFSNYARPGYASRHNIKYWKRTEYLGFGVGAASFFKNTRWTNTADMGLYRMYADSPGVIRKDVKAVTLKEAIEEFMFLGLRMTEGISDREFREAFGMPVTDVYGKILARQEREGLLVSDGDGRFRLTRRGAEVSNVVLSDYLDPPLPDGS